DQAQAPPEGGAAGADGGPVVAEEPQGVGGGEGEEVLAHEAAGDDVAAGEHLDAGLGEALSVVEFGGDDEAGAGQSCDLGGGAGGGGREEHLAGGADGVAGLAAAGEPHDGVGERGLAVGAFAEREAEDLFADLHDEGQAEEALHVGDQGGVVAEGVAEEGVEAGRGLLGVGGNEGGAGVQLLGVGGAYLAGAQVDDSGGGVELPRLGVEGVEGCDDAGVGAGDLDHGLQAAGGQGAGLVLEVALAFGEGAGDVAGEFGDVAAFVPGPAVAVPVEPSALGAVADLVGVPVDQAQGVAVVGARVGLRARLGGGLVDGQGGGAVGGRGRDGGDGGQVPDGLGALAVAAAAEFAGGGTVVAAVLEERVGAELGVRGLRVELSGRGEDVQAVALGVAAGGGG